MGRIEGGDKEKHGHVTAIVVQPEHRKQGLARFMMASFEEACEQKEPTSFFTKYNHPNHFVDLYVRPSNEKAVKMYEALGYAVYARVKSYYSSSPIEDAFIMRKALSADPLKTSMKPLDRVLTVEDLQ